MKVGIVGGTFNPVHVGHLVLGECAYEEAQLDEIWFMPNAIPPHKQITNKEVSTQDRANMLQLAIQEQPYFQLNAYEIERANHISYTYQTLEDFHVLYPEHSFYFIIGSDSLFAIESWKCPDKILQACTLLVACRENTDLDNLQKQIQYLNSKYACQIQLLQMPLLEISSSVIRKRVKQNKNIKYLVSNSVRKYIKCNQLYQK